MDDTYQTEVNRVNAAETLSDFEKSVTSDIMFWAYEQNERLGLQGKEMLKFDTFDNLARAYWDSIISTYGQRELRATK